jgi:hypothetical protein
MMVVVVLSVDRINFISGSGRRSPRLWIVVHPITHDSFVDTGDLV